MKIVKSFFAAKHTLRFFISSITKFITAILSLLIFVNITSCNGVSEPEIQPGRRDYVWEVDTVTFPGSNQTIMQSIWGINSQNIWIAGHNERGSGKLYHYDGKKWAPIELAFLPSSYTFHSILGFDDNSFYMVGSINYLTHDNFLRIIDSSLIIKHDGSMWKTSLINKGRALFSISGTKFNIYAAGFNGTLFRSNGIVWEKINFDFDIPSTFETKYITSILYRRSNEVCLIYYCLATNTNEDRNYFVIEAGDKWIKVDSFSSTNKIKWGTKLWESNKNNLYSVNPSFYKYNGIVWEKLISDNNLYTAIGGIDDNNIFVAGEKVLHFNGSDFFEFNNLSYKYGLARAIHCFQNEVFIVFSNGNKSFVAKGRLKVLSN